MATKEQLEQENEQLRAQIAELHSKQERLARWRTRVAGFATGAAARILFGRELVGSLQAWLRGLRRAIGAKTVDDRVLDEMGDVLAAIVRRVIRVGVLGAVIAALPIILLVWQNILIQRQVNQQASEYRTVRRAEFLATIYELDCEGGALTKGSSSDAEADAEKSGDIRAPDQVCRPKAPIRERQDAALAYAGIELGRGARIDLSRANLRGANFRGANFSYPDAVVNLLLRGVTDTVPGADLSETDLRDADLRGADLGKTDLRGADLSGADLRGADLSVADLRGANLSRANLSRANLSWGADFSGAHLNEADLSEADLSGAFNLTQEQIETAVGDARTKLPLDLKRPTHWIKEE